jgi:hypothetical protein
MPDFKFQFNRNQIRKTSREKIIEELEKVAKHSHYTDFKEDDFSSLSEISYYTVIREFGSWEKAMQFLFDYLKNKGVDFKITSRRSAYTEQEMFSEMERIWRNLGHRPSRNEWVASQPQISYDAIYRRFGSWKNACLQFIEYKSGETIEFTTKKPIEKVKFSNNNTNKNKVGKTRDIPLSIRIKVLSRDNFRCVFCGRSPATEAGIRLHIDHVLPFSKGGTNTLENLQTLCEECNIGKSNREL